LERFEYIYVLGERESNGKKSSKYLEIVFKTYCPAGSVAQVVEYLPNKCEVPSSNPNATK
jgi:hypothetical protein